MRFLTRSTLFSFTSVLVLAGCNATVEESQRQSSGASLSVATAPTPSVEAKGGPKTHVAPGVAARTVFSPAADAAGQSTDKYRSDGFRMFSVIQPNLASRHIGIDNTILPHRESGDRYAQVHDNPVRVVAESPVSTFAIDVDTGSYSNVRRMLTAGQLPPKDAVRVEELVNYFPYQYAHPSDGRPFAVHTTMTPAPWNANRVLLIVGIKGIDVAKDKLPPANLVFLVDVSGSMNSAAKLPLLKSSLKLLVKEMRSQDRITLVTYASTTVRLKRE